MLTYAAKLRIKRKPQTSEESWEQLISSRVNDVMNIMDLTDLKGKKVPEEHMTRGVLGGELRRLLIASEIIALPPLIVISEPALSLELAASVHIFERLRILAKRGHIVLCACSAPSPQVYSYFDSIVLLSEGFSIFASSKDFVERHFCSPALGYVRRADVEIVDFVMDIASGVERPSNKRVADPPSLLQQQFESSDYFSQSEASENGLMAGGGGAGREVHALPRKGFPLFGYAIHSPISILYRTWVTTHRAFLVKLREWDVMKKTIGSSLFVGTLVGYIQYNQASYGYYTMTMTKLPYPQTSNVTALLFFTTAFVFVQQALNVHIICNKILRYRFEQRAKVTPTIAFTFATLASEVPFTVIQSVIFSTIVYFMSDMNKGFYNYFYFASTLAMLSVLALITAIMLASILQKEFLVRDTYLLFSFLMVLLSGFPFQLPTIRDYIEQITYINPLRWVYEALMNWKFATYYADGSSYCLQFGFATFTPSDIYKILGNFIIVSGSLLILFLLPPPNFLHRKYQKTSRPSMRQSQSSIGSAGSDAEVSLTPRNSETVRPVIFTKESSVTSKSNLSITVSQQGLEVAARGPTVVFNNVTYRVKDTKEEGGFKKVLSNVSGQFDWGKLSAIMGASGSGKSSLLHILAGDTGVGSQMTGDVLFNQEYVDKKMPLWRRCALVEARDELYRDLTVKECIMYAMQLRCINRHGLRVVESNVTRTLEILHLEGVANKKTKNLTPGERRRVSIAEEIVHGPSLLLIDEPTNELGPHEEALMLRTFREMVNQDRTVILTIQKPSQNVFKLFDTLLLLSQGRVIYHGPSADASNYFISNPCGFSFSRYTNAADFLTDIASQQATDKEGKLVDAVTLEIQYETSEQFSRLRSKINSSSAAAMATAAQRRSASKKVTDSVSASASAKSGASEMENDLHVSLLSASAGPSDDNKPSATSSKMPLAILKVSTSIKEYFDSFPETDVRVSFMKFATIFRRSFKNLLNRKKLILGSFVLHIALALILGWILGDTDGNIYNLTSFFAIGTLLLMLSNLQLVLFLFRSQQIFLKEHARGLYSTSIHWAASFWPVFILKVSNAIIYSLISYNLLELSSDSSVQGFFILATCCSVLAGFTLSETVINIVPDIRGAYLIIPALIFVHFSLSGLFIKYQTMPTWISPWVPSLSIIRWAMQSEWINAFASTTCNLPSICVFPYVGSYSTYGAFLGLFGWGGKTKWYCLGMIIINFMVYRFTALLASGLRASLQRGERRFKVVA